MDSVSPASCDIIQVGYWKVFGQILIASYSNESFAEAHGPYL